MTAAPGARIAECLGVAPPRGPLEGFDDLGAQLGGQLKHRGALFDGGSNEIALAQIIAPSPPPRGWRRRWRGPCPLHRASPLLAAAAERALTAQLLSPAQMLRCPLAGGRAPAAPSRRRRLRSPRASASKTGEGGSRRWSARAALSAPAARRDRPCAWIRWRHPGCRASASPTRSPSGPRCWPARAPAPPWPRLAALAPRVCSTAW